MRLGRKIYAAAEGKIGLLSEKQPTKNKKIRLSSIALAFKIQMIYNILVGVEKLTFVASGGRKCAPSEM